MKTIILQPSQAECRKWGIGWDPQDIEATIGWIALAKREKDAVAMSDLFAKLRLQIDALEEEMEQEIAS